DSPPGINDKQRPSGNVVEGVNFGCNVAEIVCFFPAEDGIRAGHVTGVQTCALPISAIVPNPNFACLANRTLAQVPRDSPLYELEIGRASCREREELPGGDVAL